MGVHLDGALGGGVSRLEVIEQPTGRRRRTKAERARIAGQSEVPGLSVADVARRDGMMRWQVCVWRKKLRKVQLVVAGSMAGVPMCAELLVEGVAEQAPPAPADVEVEIAVGDVVIRAGTDAEQGMLLRAIRAARAATS